MAHEVYIQSNISGISCVFSNVHLYACNHITDQNEKKIDKEMASWATILQSISYVAMNDRYLITL